MCSAAQLQSGSRALGWNGCLCVAFEYCADQTNNRTFRTLPSSSWTLLIGRIGWFGCAIEPSHRRNQSSGRNTPHRRVYFTARWVLPNSARRDVNEKITYVVSAKLPPHPALTYVPAFTCTTISLEATREDARPIEYIWCGLRQYGWPLAISSRFVHTFIRTDRI